MKIDSQPKIIKPDVDVKKCEDMGSEEACKAFKPLCPMFPTRAYYFCRKTCEKCAKDTPKGMGRSIEIKKLLLQQQQQKQQ